MKKIYISLFLLSLPVVLLLLRWVSVDNFMWYLILLFLTFVFSILTFCWDFSMIFKDYQQLSCGKKISISIFLILFYTELYVFLRLYLQEVAPKEFITLIFISQIPLMFLILAEFIRASSEGSIKYRIFFIVLVFLFLFSQKEISNYLTSAAGVLLISNMLFSTEFLSYMNKTKFNEEVLNKIKNILTEKKDEWKVKVNILFISYSVSIAIKNSIPIGLKKCIIENIKSVLEYEIEKWIIERMIISYCLCICLIVIYIVLKNILDGKWFLKTVYKFIDRQYKLLDK